MYQSRSVKRAHRITRRQRFKGSQDLCRSVRTCIRAWVLRAYTHAYMLGCARVLHARLRTALCVLCALASVRVVCTCVRVVRKCVRACVRSWVRACVCAYVCAYMSVRACGRACVWAESQLGERKGPITLAQRFCCGRSPPKSLTPNQLLFMHYVKRRKTRQVSYVRAGVNIAFLA